MRRYYHKIETILNRDEQTKKLIPNSYRNKTVEFLKGDEWEFTEKVDGTNIIVYWDGHKVEFGGRTERAIIPNHLLERLDELFGGEINEEMFEQKFGENEVTLYGEGFGDKIQTNGYISGVDFILFDVFAGNNFQPREVVEDIARYFNIRIVPIVLRGTLNDAISYVKTNPDSAVSETGVKMEGVVGRPAIELNDRAHNRVIVKVKYSDFKDFEVAE